MRKISGAEQRIWDLSRCSMQRIEEFLERCVALGGSDLHFKSDTGKVYIRINGELELAEDAAAYKDSDLRAELYRLWRPEQIERFERELDLDFALAIPGLSRFRGNA